MTANEVYYKKYYANARQHLTNFFWWSRAEGRTYDIIHGDFKRAWKEYMQSGDQFAEVAKLEYDNNELAQRAFNDYAKTYLTEVRNAQRENRI